MGASAINVTFLSLLMAYDGLCLIPTTTPFLLLLTISIVHKLLGNMWKMKVNFYCCELIIKRNYLV